MGQHNARVSRRVYQLVRRHYSILSLSTGCYLTYTGTNPASSVYWPIAVMLEDYYPLPPNTKMDSAPLQFVVEVAPANSPCVPVSPLVVDSCSLALAPLSVCPSNITAPANSYVSSSYYTVTANSTANLTCNYGFVPMPTTQIYMICLVPKSASPGVWTSVGNCTGTQHNLLVRTVRVHQCDSNVYSKRSFTCKSMCCSYRWILRHESERDSC